ncbi:MAG TPA: hypothetical protein VK395_28660 [Gemmataceae bacterium]|nr:hypothetical protein [Gemmataceae bacterium]
MDAIAPQEALQRRVPEKNEHRLAFAGVVAYLSPMSNENRQLRRSALFSFRFLATAAIGTLMMAVVAVLGPPAVQLAVLGAFISILGGLFLTYLGQEDQRERQRANVIESLSVPLSLASDPELFQQYQEISRGLIAVAKDADAVLRQIALLKFASLAEQIDGLVDRKIVFAMTEEWRTVYEQLLTSPDVRQYRSIAWVRSSEYWQDEPGRQSMRVNFDAAHRGLLIERVILLSDDLWPREELMPSPDILPWIQEQHNHGLWITLARESDVSREPDLLVDMGIYGNRAVGFQELDEHCRTLRFTLDLNQQAVRLADARWQRLLLYARPFGELLDQLPRQG